MSRILLAMLCLGYWSMSVAAGADDITKKPYHLHVICHFGRNRQLITVPFKTGVKDELRDSLQSRLGRMVRVDVMERHPRLEAVLQSGDLGVLDSWHEISDSKLHFVLIDFVDGKYRIRTRQYDGLTGLASPRTRVAWLQAPADRPLVGHRAVQMVLADLGIVGAVNPSEPGPEIDVTFRGLGLTSNPKQWLRAGDIFAVSVVYQSNGRLEGRREPWALLRVLDDPKAGVAHCRFLHRFADMPLGQPGLTTRFLKLHTTVGHLRLRLIDEQDRSPLIAQPVTVSQDNFGPNPDESTLNTGANGLVTSRKEYRNVAFVEVHNAAGRTLSMVPVPILGDEVVECVLRGDAVHKDNAAGDVEMQKQIWLGHVNETRAVVMDLLTRLGRLLNARNNTEALTVSEAGLRDLQSAIARHEAALKNLQAQARKAGLTDAAQLAPAEQRAFEDLTQWKNSLAGTVSIIRGIVSEENNPAIKQALGKIEQAKLLEKQAEYGKALALYEAALPALPDGGNKPKLQARVNELRDQWKIKNDKHKDARQFIYETWPTLTTGTAIADNLDKARKAFAVCKSVGDRLTVSKLWLASAAQLNVLAKEKAALSSVQGEEAEKKKKVLLKLSADLAAFYKDVSGFLAGK